MIETHIIADDESDIRIVVGPTDSNVDVVAVYVVENGVEFCGLDLDEKDARALIGAITYELRRRGKDVGWL